MSAGAAPLPVPLPVPKLSKAAEKDENRLFRHEMLADVLRRRLAAQRAGKKLVPFDAFAEAKKAWLLDNRGEDFEEADLAWLVTVVPGETRENAFCEEERPALSEDAKTLLGKDTLKCAELKQLLELLLPYQHTGVELILMSHGHAVKVTPPYYFELQATEHGWGIAKMHARDKCDFTREGLEKSIKEGLAKMNEIGEDGEIMARNLVEKTRWHLNEFLAMDKMIFEDENGNLIPSVRELSLQRMRFYPTNPLSPVQLLRRRCMEPNCTLVTRPDAMVRCDDCERFFHVGCLGLINDILNLPMWQCGCTHDDEHSRSVTPGSSASVSLSGTPDTSRATSPAPSPRGGPAPVALDASFAAAGPARSLPMGQRPKEREFGKSRTNVEPGSAGALRDLPKDAGARMTKAARLS
jgi:hypothetical protein